MALKKEAIRSQAELMRKLKVSRQVANKWWNGQTATDMIRAVDLFKIADGLRVSIRWLLTGKGSMLPGLRMTPEQHRALEIFNSFTEEHKGWRDDWLTEGVRRLERLNLKPSISNPYPVQSRQ